MARPRRHHLPGVPLHIIQRGNDRKPCFLIERDYIVYLGKLRQYSEKFNVQIHSFVLMTNHVHLLLTPSTTSGVSELMQSLGRYYVRYINASHGRTGTLWEGRFKDSLVDSERYFLIVSRYIESNPVRANMVAHPAEYPWSSFRCNAMGLRMQLLTPHELYLALGVTAMQRQTNYSALFANDIPAETVGKIRAAVGKSWVLGDSNFKRGIEGRLGYALPPFPQGGDRKSTRPSKSKAGD